jgi:hypothetical protein
VENYGLKPLQGLSTATSLPDQRLSATLIVDNEVFTVEAAAKRS